MFLRAREVDSSPKDFPAADSRISSDAATAPDEFVWMVTSPSERNSMVRSVTSKGPRGTSELYQSVLWNLSPAPSCTHEVRHDIDTAQSSRVRRGESTYKAVLIIKLPVKSFSPCFVVDKK